MSEELADIVIGNENYECARAKAMAELLRGFHFGGTPASREELHER